MFEVVEMNCDVLCPQSRWGVRHAELEIVIMVACPEGVEPLRLPLNDAVALAAALNNMVDISMDNVTKLGLEPGSGGYEN